MERFGEELSFAIPEGYRHIEEEELSTLYRSENLDRVGYRYGQEDRFFVFMKRKSNRLLLFLSSMDAIAKRGASQTAAMLEDKHYRFDGFLNLENPTLIVEGYGYAYDVKKGRKQAYVAYFKGKRYLYGLSYFATDGFEGALEEFKTIVASLSVADRK